MLDVGLWEGLVNKPNAESRHFMKQALGKLW